MQKIAYIVLGVSIFLTVLFFLIWIAGLVIGQTFGGLIHLLLIFSILTIFGIVVGVIMLIVSLIQKK